MMTSACPLLGVGANRPESKKKAAFSDSLLINPLNQTLILASAFAIAAAVSAFAFTAASSSGGRLLLGKYCLS